MDKLIDLESVKSMISSIVKENSLSDEEIAECGAACGCGSCATTSADLGAEVQYLGDKKKAKKEFLNFGTTEVNGNDAVVNSGNEERNTEVKDEGLLDAIGGGKNEASLEEDELEEMPRGIIAPQELARRDYVREYPDSGIKTADQFLRKVINNPEAEGHEKYVNVLSQYAKQLGKGHFSNVSSGYDDMSKGFNRLSSQKVANFIGGKVLDHRKAMSKSSYASKGLTNAYGRNIIKHGPYYKPGRDMASPVVQQSTDIGQKISNDYNNVEDPSKSNDVLVAFFKSKEWKSLDGQTKMRVLNTIDNEADLDMTGANIIAKMKDSLSD